LVWSACPSRLRSKGDQSRQYGQVSHAAPVGIRRPSHQTKHA
jgi:hypothetical protein